MPVARIVQTARLQVRYQVGLNEEGMPVYRTRTLANVRADSDDEALWAAAAAISGLQKYPVAEVRRVDSAVLAEA